MNTIEQRVLIPVAPVVIWNILRDIANNPKWQVDCRHVTYISGKQESRGARWRFTSISGREYTLEVTAWYKEVGYEYRIVDGNPFKDAIGRIKLHETPDGTVVHWEFLYEMGGFVGGLRNSLITRRNLENTIADSLWALWELANQSRHEQPRDYVYRSLMRDVPDAQGRAGYEPNFADDEDPISTQVVAEPPIAEDDTRPGASAGVDAPASKSATVAPSGLSTRAELISSATRPSNTLSEVDGIPDSPVLSQSGLDISESGNMDSTELSVFQLFGIKPPSQTQTSKEEHRDDATQPTRDNEELPKLEVTDTIKTSAMVVIGRHGLRVALRNQQIRVRRPK